MKTNLLILWAAFVSATLLSAAEPNGPMGSVGRVLVLDTEQTLEGEIAVVGNSVRVGRTLGEILIPKERVLFIGADKSAAYAFMVRRANLRDADEHVRLSRWCMMQSLRPEALQHAKKALELRPGSKDVKLMVDTMEYAMNRPESSGQSSNIQTVGAQLPEPTQAPLDFNAEAYPMFVSKVQPILMNACASCHASADKSGNFRLQRVYEGGNRRATQWNLNAVLQQIDRNRLGASPLLIKALTLHGDMPRPAIRDRQSPMFRWIEVFARTATNTPDSTPLIFSAPSATAVMPAVGNTPLEGGFGTGTTAATPAVPMATPTASATPGMLPASVTGGNLPTVPPTVPFGAGDEPPPVIPTGGTTGGEFGGAVPMPGVVPANLPPQPRPMPMPSTSPATDDPFDPAQFNRPPKGR
ncbi:hypothetical protein [Tuwongella immobilis]|nr:hypothetical protein [Tuwongella immobilis]